MRCGVKGERFFILDEYGPDNAGIIRPTEVQDRIGNNANFFVGINERKNSLSESNWIVLNSITAPGVRSSLIDSNGVSRPQRFYMVAAAD